MKFRLACTAITLLSLTIPTISAGAASHSATAHRTTWYAPIARDHRPGDWATWTCIIYAESRSIWAHPNLGDNNRLGNSGIFQIVDSTWKARSGFSFHVWQATPRQQALGALSIRRVDGFSPWRGDGCVG